MPVHTLLLLAGFFLLTTRPICAQMKADDPAALKIEKIEPDKAGIGDTLTVKIKNWPKEKAVPTDWVLYLDGVAIPGVKPVNADVRDGEFRFHLQRDERSKAAWATLLREKRFRQSVAVAVGPKNGPDTSVAPLERAFTFKKVCYGWFLGGVGACLVGLVFLAWKGNALRDTDTTSANGPLSLGRMQMGFWTALILPVFLYLWYATGDFMHALSAQALILMGISAATGFSAVAVDSEKRRQTQALKAERTALENQITPLTDALNAHAVPVADIVRLTAEKQPRQARLDEVDAQLATRSALDTESKNPIADLLCDANGLTLHRFQMVVWTLTLGTIFLCGVCKDLAMPEFDSTLLTLMGISSSTYIGFKFPEKKA